MFFLSGWKYIVAYESSQKYKEGKWILDKVSLRKVTHFVDSGDQTRESLIHRLFSPDEEEDEDEDEDEEMDDVEVRENGNLTTGTGRGSGNGQREKEKTIEGPMRSLDEIARFMTTGIEPREEIRGIGVAYRR